MPAAFPIAVFISGRGSNLQALIERAEHFKIELVCSNLDCPGLDYARNAGIKTVTHTRKNFPSRLAQQEALFGAAQQQGVKLIALAGFMQIIEQSIVDAWFGKMINIHPSLLPKFPGLDTHQRAIDAKEAEHGCSVHFVDGGMDTGPLIAQGRCGVLPTDDAHSLAQRVLGIEHRIYAWVLNQIARGGSTFDGRTVQYNTTTEAAAAHEGFVLHGVRMSAR